MLFVGILHTHKYGGVLDILISIPFSFTRYYIEKISNKIPRIVYRPKISHYFSTLIILDCQIQNHHCTPKYFLG